MCVKLSLFFIGIVVAVSARDCTKVFKDDDKQAKISEKCMKDLNITPNDLPKSEKEFASNFDDKCFGKCYMTGLKFIVDGKFDREAMKKDVADHILDSDIKEKTIAYSMKCLDQVEDAMKSSGGKITKDNECKLPAQFMYCSMIEEGKIDLGCDQSADAPKVK